MSQSILDRIALIVEELKTLQSSPMSYVDKNDKFRIPRMIASGNGRSILVSRKIDNEIIAVADQLIKDDPSLKPRVTHAEWRSLVRREFGPALEKINFAIAPEKNAATVISEVERVLKNNVSALGEAEFVFGCTLFENESIAPFSIGPVHFEPKLKWLERLQSGGFISLITRRRVERAWSGKCLKTRKPSFDSFRERDVLDAVGNCPFVCSVLTNGFGMEAGREKALTAARIAITAVSLIWAVPSKALEGMNLLYDRNVRQQTILIKLPRRKLSAGSHLSQSPFGPRLGNNEWHVERKKYEDLFRVVGEILAYVVAPDGSNKRPKVMDAFYQALLWFHEGCREVIPLMAIVKFTSSLEALASGGKSSGIRKLINARLGVQDDQSIRKDGLTVKEAVDEIYSDGRSRTLHGTNDKLGHDWTETKNLAEQLARLCLVICIEWAYTNPSCNDPISLLKP